MDTYQEKLQAEQFAAQFAFGVGIPEALKSAGYEVHTISFGMSLLRQPEIMALVDGHRDWIKTKLAHSLETVIQQLDRDREFAYQTEQAGAAVSATMNKAKLLGYLESDQKGMPKKIVITWGEDEPISA